MWSKHLKELTIKLCDKYKVPIVYRKDISDTMYLELIVLSSQLFPVSFAFERDVAEVKELILTALINYDDIQKIAEKEIQELFSSDF